ncbi:MAG: DNA translocase FtsK 4TM domain-containing protein, partial [Candidatus Yanofskybacteria bacterium]|nr:DNA translocase FtsK 4TM domain-containing protein [Candidatus Yanofskybacteria bacterium]
MIQKPVGNSTTRLIEEENLLQLSDTPSNVKFKKKRKNNALEAKENWADRFDISQETKNSIFGLFSFLAAVISILAFAGKAGTAGDALNSASRALFGWGFFLIPIAFGLLSFAFIRSISRKIYTSAVLGTSIFVLASLAVFYILGGGEFEERLLQGGYLGVVFGYPLRSMLGFTASFIILIALMVMSILLALNVPLYQLVTQKEEDKKSVDNIIIKQGNEQLKKADGRALSPKVQPAKAEISDMAFVIKNLKAGKWTLPPLDLLNDDKESPSTGDINASAMIIKRTLSNFSIDVEMGEVSIGPTVTQYTLRPAIGVKLSRIGALSPDLSLALAAHPIRIEAPIPGKSLVGIEVPNKKIATVTLRSLLEQEDFSQSKNFMPLSLGRDVSGNPVYAGLEKMPHLLIAGATGTGKSVMINSILLSLLYKHSPDILKLILIDPKRVELTAYNEIPHLIAPVITDNKKVLGALRWAISEMDRRYDILSKGGARDIFSYNAKLSSKNESLMPFIIIVIDELADLMVSYGRDVEAAIVRLAQMSRAVGIHLILSTQRPSVEVITGLIKANITSRIALQVASQVDSRTILDMGGAEKLLGRGDMLFMSSDTSKPRRLQAPLS